MTYKEAREFVLRVEKNAFYEEADRVFSPFNLKADRNSMQIGLDTVIIFSEKTPAENIKTLNKIRLVSRPWVNFRYNSKRDLIFLESTIHRLSGKETHPFTIEHTKRLRERKEVAE